MKNLTIILLFFIFVSSCKTEHQNPLYKSIELSYSSGWPYAFSLSIDSENIVRKCDYNIINDLELKQCYCDTLNQNQIDSINYFIKKIENNNPALNYESNCQDCRWYLVKINLPGKTIESRVVGKKHKITIDSLANTIIRISFRMKNKVDSTYKFSSTEKLLPPPPPDTTIFFHPSNG